ncbi:hypothetical protein [Clostridium septicum]|uniref:DUF3784 domain-containing protein n=1 Tax=Clostridium septicum TaxID=1504 RepID=A0ABY5B4C5_CLOSE|nr:hypothetical protein [Clostridium septicum]MDU1313189.1 hypothetical protein [Clostridium septicum]UEC19741.1 hypothetical protein LK444_09950 [Clostridium septicum]USS02199.1 hypothetical protein NH397_07225 [Clostridium septicum]WLF70778.1 hypothetical protein Q6375_07320 [Clostridium septicum]
MKKLSNWLFYSGIVMGILGYYRINKMEALLLPGVCHVEDNRWILIIGIILLIFSILI